MHLSMHNWMRSEPIEITVARLARFGYGSIEIKGEPDQYDTKDVRALLAEHRLTCWGAVTLTLAERNLCAKDEEQRAASVQYVKDVVTMVKELDGHGDHDRAEHGRQDRPRRHARSRSGSGASRACKEIHEHASKPGCASPSSRSTASRPISSTAASRRSPWPMRSRPTSACASTAST